MKVITGLLLGFLATDYVLRHGIPVVQVMP